MATNCKEVEDWTPYLSLECSEEGEDQSDFDQETEQGGGLLDGDEDDASQIPPDLKTTDLPPQVPILGEGRPDPPGPGPAVMPGMEALQATLGQFMGTMNEMVERLAQRRDELPGGGPRRPTGNPQGDASKGLESVCRRLVA